MTWKLLGGKGAPEDKTILEQIRTFDEKTRKCWPMSG